jgi:putative ABC transport system ATP-binding protein
VSGAGVLELDGVVKQYSDGEEILRAVDDVTLRIGAGEVCALYGPSGSGKTTLLLLCAGFLVPDGGVVRFAGRDLASYDSDELTAYQRRDVGFIYQSVHLMNGVPALENAAIKLVADGVPLRRASAAACELLERVGLARRLDHPPERLSGGERQRVAIARALVNDPRLILADEPTGNLDSRRGAQILELLARIARERGAAVLLATHDPQAAAVADRRCALRDGRLLEGRAGAELYPAPPPLTHSVERRPQ